MLRFRCADIGATKNQWNGIQKQRNTEDEKEEGRDDAVPRHHIGR